jgi:hypothetical protein
MSFVDGRCGVIWLSQDGFLIDLRFLPRYDLTQKMGIRFQSPYRDRPAGGSVQLGLSAAGGDMVSLSIAARRINANC